MAQGSRKLNFKIDNDVADDLEKYVPSGQRSRLVTQAIARELALQRRKSITDRLLELRSRTPGEKLLSQLVEDRHRG
jgi:hypothetical protein